MARAGFISALYALNFHHSSEVTPRAVDENMPFVVIYEQAPS